MASPRLLLIDNRDSFTWNLAQRFGALGASVEVVRAEGLDLAALGGRIEGGAELAPAITHVVVGPGPGSPAGMDGARRTLDLCRGRIPWLGVCLGHQLLAEAMGARVVPTGVPVHGKRDRVAHDGTGIFRDLPRPFLAARYHSLAVDPESVPAELRVVARSAGPLSESDPDGAAHVPPTPAAILAIAVPGEATWGVQFHPESFMTPEGDRLLAAFLAGVVCPIVSIPDAGAQDEGDGRVRGGMLGSGSASGDR